MTGIAAGYAHTCAVVAGGVRCWGNNSDRELGNGTTTASNVAVTTITAGSGVTAIAAGTSSGFGLSHTCVVINGGVQCWGSNDAGNLGGSTTSQEIRYAIAANSNATAVAAGATHTCAVVEGGIKCWGSNNAGQNGDGSAQTQLPQNYVYTAVPAGSLVTSISAGAAHTCIVVNGGVQCWGDSSRGRLGSPLVPYQMTTPQVLVPTGRNVATLTAGSRNTCAVQNGGLTCWGADYGSSVANAAPAQVFSDGQQVSNAAAGVSHLCARVDGKVVCRGLNANGQAGNNSTLPGSEPAALPADAKVSGLAAGSTHTCAVVDGGVPCWGANNAGQLGNASTTPSLVPVIAIAANSKVTAVSARAEHTCAIVDGGVQCWGRNTAGQVGNNSTANVLVPTSILAAGSNATAIASGDAHTCAVVNGGVQCWGSNANGQLGTGNTTPSLIPVQTIAAGSQATAIAAGSTHTCALVNGGVQCWGDNSAGELGNASLTQSLTPVTAIPAGSNAIALAAGSFHSCALLNGGALCWGSNAYGQLASLAINGPQKVFAALTNGAVVVIPPAPPTVSITAPANNATFQAPANIAIVANATAGGGATIAKVDFYHGTTLIGTSSSTASPYTINWTSVASGSYNVTAKATDSNGLTATSAPLAITVLLTAPTITIASPANLASVAGGNVIVSGSYQGTANSGVVVNGVIATLGANGTFTADIPLSAGSNSITATVTAPGGETATTSITVTAATPIASPLTVTVDKTNGVAPLAVTFIVTNTGTTPASYAMDGAQPSTVPVGGFATLAITYSQLGANLASFALTDNLGVTVTKTFLIEVRDDAATDVKLRAIWNGMNSALVAGDKATAMGYLNSAAKAKYGPVFDALMPSMPTIVASYSPPALSTQSGDYAEYAIRRVNNGVNRIFLIYFVRDADGVWRVDEM